MNRTGKTFIVIAVCICTAVVVTSLTAAKLAGADATMTQKEAMSKYATKCTKLCQKNMEDIPLAMMALDEAVKAIDAGDTALAKAGIEEAKSMLADMKMSVEQYIQAIPAVNDRCPISKNPVDMKNVPLNLTRMHKGMKVGFCCPTYMSVWDGLSDEEKDAKLADVINKGLKEKMLKKGSRQTSEDY